MKTVLPCPTDGHLSLTLTSAGRGYVICMNCGILLGTVVEAYADRDGDLPREEQGVLFAVAPHPTA